MFNLRPWQRLFPCAEQNFSAVDKHLRSRYNETVLIFFKYNSLCERHTIPSGIDMPFFMRKMMPTGNHLRQQDWHTPLYGGKKQTNIIFTGGEEHERCMERGKQGQKVPHLSA